MKLSNFKRISKEDFSEEYHTLIEKLGFSLNNFAQELFTLFSKNITIEDNLLQEIKTLEITTLASNSMIPSSTSQFRNNLSKSLKGIIVINAENLTNNNLFPTSAVQVFWTENNKIITINRITGLQANNKYRIKLLTIGG